MITKCPTNEQLKRWKALFEANRAKLAPNRKSGPEIDGYFCRQYGCEPVVSENFASVVEWNILHNEVFREKLRGKKPEIRCYEKNGVLLGIDLVSGEFFAESSEMEKAAALYDDLFLFRGLDESDLKNFVLVGQYLELKK